MNSNSVNSCARGGQIRRLRLHRLRQRIDRDIAVDRHQFLAQQDGIAIVLQRFAIGFALNLGGMLQQVSSVPKR